MRFPSPALIALGWSPTRDTQAAAAADTNTHNPNTPNSDTNTPDAGTPPVGPYRVIRQDRGRWTIRGADGEFAADLRGRLRRQLALVELPGVGDWVLASIRPREGTASIEAVLPRTSALVRKTAGTTSEPQVVAANVDTVFVVVPADAAPNPRRIERELALVWESGATPVVVVTKADLGHDFEWVTHAAVGVDVTAVDGVLGTGVGDLARWCAPGATIALLGPSGAGKSTLANALLGTAHFTTGAVREDDRRGRHTTTWRELVQLPGGALLIDNPGVRELALFDGADGISATFDDIEEVAANCKFSDCAHDGEPGCAVAAALHDGTLGADRFASWQHLQREVAFQARRNDARLAAEQRRKWAIISKEAAKRTRH